MAPLAQPSPEAGHAVARLAKLAADFHAAFFPPPSEVFVNPRQKLHVTLFFCSHPSDPRPDPFAPRGGLASLTIPPEARPGATADVVAKEVAALRVMGAESLDPFVLELDRIVLARCGVGRARAMRDAGEVALGAQPDLPASRSAGPACCWPCGERQMQRVKRAT